MPARPPACRLARALGAGALALAGAGCAPILGAFDQDLGAPGMPQPAASPKGSVAKGGPEAKFVDVGGLSGILYGARAVRHFAAQRAAYAGVMAYGPLPLVGKQVAPVFGYVGGLAGWELRPTPWLRADLGLVAGLTSDTSDASPNPLSRQLLVEPSLAVGVPLPFMRGATLQVVGSWIALPLAGVWDGYSVGLRFETKALELRAPTDEL